ncbi:MAG: S8 family serine peptidase [Thermoanaerobaculaceae bacterium]|nr:S8 family serine peptidase [Thermoanaerobaculaceae bacterium]MDI9621452.1 S8 family serine peptidase [Acidobacteriota bacterium]
MRGRTATLLTAIAMFVVIVSPALALEPSATLEAPARSPAAAAQPQAAPLVQPANAAGSARYIVILSDPAVPSYTGGIAGYPATNPATRGQTRLDAESVPSRAFAAYLKAEQDTFVASLRKTLGRSPQVVYQLQFALNAVIMVLDPAEAAQIAKLPGVASVERDEALPLATDVGPQWIGAPAIWNGTATGGLPGTKGEGVIIGVLDTGINMDHPSFAATGGDGYVHTNPFGAGNYKGWCNPSNPNYNPAYVCNAKLVGAWDYSDASWGETDGPEDNDGHGSHTSSTAAGNYLAPGTVTLGSYSFSPAISGVAPHANIIMYDVCGTTCYNTDVIAALNQAILDGVHVINESIGISGDAFSGIKQQAYLSVFNAGITSARSAGNTGPGAGTVGGTPPWVITVGANTHNRSGSNAVTSLSGGSTTPPGGGTLIGLGVSNASAVGGLVYAGDAPYSDPLCQSPAAPNTFTGKIVVCDRGTNARVAKGWNVLQGGAIGMVLANDAANGASLNGDLHHLPAVHISYADGVALKTWLASGTGHQGRIAGTTFSYAPSNGDIMAGFSSRGPHPIANLLTPDVSNPGVDILAAYRSGSIDPETTSVEYAFTSGTSMASPHTAGSAALVKAVHPTWSPAEIKSALMGTGKYTGIRKEDGVTPAIPFDMGAGRVDLNHAANASLVLNETGANFAAGAANPEALNLASLADAACAGACSWTRTVKAARAGAWTATYVTPAGMTLSATPSSFTLTAGQTQTLNVLAAVGGLPLNQYAFGYVVLTQGSGAAAGDVIHLTVVVRPIQPTARHTVTASVGTPSGSIAPPSQTVAHGASATFTVTPDAGFEIDNVGGTCPAGTLAGNVYTTGAITADCEVVANFRQTTHTVTASVGTPSGTITPPSQTVSHGASATFTVTPAAGYLIDNVGGTCPYGSLVGSTYTTGPITADCEVVANFRGDPSVLAVPTLGPAGGALLGLLLAGLGLSVLRRRRA